MNTIKRKTKAAVRSAKTPQVVAVKANRNRQGVRETVIIHVINGFCTPEVKVNIVNRTGKLIEQGNAKKSLTGMIWKYSTTKRNQIITGTKIIVQVFNLDGSKGEMEIVL
ncbi:MAG: hypothetical protein J7497_10060 [Chitinophagaceae bacterium]|nr:hypothetical protein [Chitinophagaceae bacterium]